MSNQRMRFGAYGERKAARHYRAAGYRVLAQNWRGKGGELDLVLRGDGVIVFAEVKTRRSDAYGAPAEAVTVAKQHRIRRLAQQYCAETGHRARQLRFDIVSVLAGEVTVLEDSF